MKYFLVIIFIFSGFFLQAQQNRFVFFQAQQGKPFYVRLGTNNYSSSAFGHLVISGLRDSTYHFYIGFPRNEIPEREFVVDLKGKDRGYDIRTENQSEVMLFEWQTGSVIRHSGKEDPSMIAMKGKKRTDPYALLMAGVVNDPLVLYMQEPVKEEVVKAPESSKVPEFSASEQKPDSSDLVRHSNNKDAGTLQTNQDDSINAPENDIAGRSSEGAEKKNEVAGDSLAIAGSDKAGEDSVIVAKTESTPSDTSSITAKTETAPSDSSSITTLTMAPGSNDSGVIRLYEETVAEGKRMLYVDNSGPGKDSIDILIVKEMPVSEPNVPVAVKESEEENSGSSIVLTNSNCTRSATEQDIDRLRVQMLKQKSDDDRVFSARKLLRNRCMRTAQVKALSELFPTDEGRYMFFDAAYPFVSDSGNFKELIHLLTDPYYINRFKAMVRM